MKRIVNTDRDKIDIVFPRPATLVKSSTAVKPKANNLLWYGINESWMDWAKLEMPEKIRNNNFEIDLDETRILKIHTVEEEKKFYHDYCSPGEWPYSIQINWPKIFSDYAGMEIGEDCIDQCYQSSSNNRYEWLFSWSVASGCVWDSTALIEFRKYNPSISDPSKDDTPDNNEAQLDYPSRYEL